ncbi:hypothetical protein L596_022600 [Steinernema carpocapsae]|uniref:Uncharacterized protein n=1 Tax=Steinernema carpocapsae TaxID=34508 RepID=A0A4V6A0A2_STECR|nr:hypothetical protein L596_022600 [Steinernema carpocapsae]
MLSTLRTSNASVCCLRSLPRSARSSTTTRTTSTSETSPSEAPDKLLPSFWTPEAPTSGFLTPPVATEGL